MDAVSQKQPVFQWLLRQSTLCTVQHIGSKFFGKITITLSTQFLCYFGKQFCGDQISAVLWKQTTKEEK